MKQRAEILKAQLKKKIGAKATDFLITRYDPNTELDFTATPIPDGEPGKRVVACLESEQQRTINTGGKLMVYTSPMWTKGTMTLRLANFSDNNPVSVGAVGTGSNVGDYGVVSYVETTSGNKFFDGGTLAGSGPVLDSAQLLEHDNTRIRVIGAGAELVNESNYTQINGSSYCFRQQADVTRANIRSYTQSAHIGVDYRASPPHDEEAATRLGAKVWQNRYGAAVRAHIFHSEPQRVSNRSVVQNLNNDGTANNEILVSGTGSLDDGSSSTVLGALTNCDTAGIIWNSPTDVTTCRVIQRVFVELYYSDDNANQLLGTTVGTPDAQAMFLSQLMHDGYLGFCSTAEEDSKYSLTCSMLQAALKLSALSHPSPMPTLLPAPPKIDDVRPALAPAGMPSGGNPAKPAGKPRGRARGNLRGN